MTVNASDRNGLELTPAADTMNAYRLTSVSTSTKKFTAYAAGTRKSNQEFNMFAIVLIPILAMLLMSLKSLKRKLASLKFVRWLPTVPSLSLPKSSARTSKSLSGFIPLKV